MGLDKIDLFLTDEFDQSQKISPVEGPLGIQKHGIDPTPAKFLVDPALAPDDDYSSISFGR